VGSYSEDGGGRSFETSVIGNPTTQVFIVAVTNGLTCLVYEREALSDSEVGVVIGGYG
jgi:hypothetical protein